MDEGKVQIDADEYRARIDLILTLVALLSRYSKDNLSNLLKILIDAALTIDDETRN